MTTAAFRFYGELNNFLPPARRGRAVEVECARAATTKHMVEAMGVPHTEVELVLVNGEPAGFSRLLEHGDRVAVYPMFTSLDVAALARVREALPAPLRFVADAHLGGLARFLRMAGFDTLYDNNYIDGDIEQISLDQERVVLTRDRELLKRRGIAHGCYVHAIKSEQQFREIVRRLALAGRVKPFTLCLTCNAPLRGVPKAAVLDRLPPSVRQHHTEFSMCDVCQRVFWKGTHWQRMHAALAKAAAPPQLSRS